jgi:hypothetical protein
MVDGWTHARVCHIWRNETGAIYGASWGGYEGEVGSPTFHVKYFEGGVQFPTPPADINVGDPISIYVNENNAVRRIIIGETEIPTHRSSMRERAAMRERTERAN